MTFPPQPPTGARAPAPPHLSPIPLSEFFQSPSATSVFLRLLFYLGLDQAFGYGLAQVFLFLKPGIRPRSATGWLIQEVISVTAALTAALILAKLERRSLGAYGLPLRKPRLKLFGQGVLLGFAEIGGVIGSIALLGGYRFGALGLHGGALLQWGMYWSVFFLLVGLGEEFSFRGYVQFTLTQGIGFWPAAIVLSAVFAAVHLGNPGENWVGVLSVFMIGMFWCFTLRRTGSLWFAIGMHASFDFGETFLFSVPNSGVRFEGHLSDAAFHGPAWLTGGAVGPEGSVFDFLLLGLFCYLFHRWHPAKQEAPPQ